MYAKSVNKDEKKEESRLENDINRKIIIKVNWIEYDVMLIITIQLHFNFMQHFRHLNKCKAKKRKRNVNKHRT